MFKVPDSDLCTETSTELSDCLGKHIEAPKFNRRYKDDCGSRNWTIQQQQVVDYDHRQWLFQSTPRGCLSALLSLQDGNPHGQVVERSRSPNRRISPDSAFQDREVLRLAKLGGFLSDSWTKKQSDERNFLAKQSREGIRNAQRQAERIEIQGCRVH